MAPGVEPESEYGKLAQRIRQMRERLGKTQEEFADMVGVSRSVVSHVESFRARPSVEMILGLLKLDNVLAPRRIDRDGLLFGRGDIFETAGQSYGGIYRDGAIDWTAADVGAMRLASQQIARIETKLGRDLAHSQRDELFRILYERVLGAHFGKVDEPYEELALKRERVAEECGAQLARLLAADPE